MPQHGNNLWKTYWNILLPPKVLHFGWKAITGCLPIKTQLQSKHVNVDRLCPFCNNEAESIIHVLVKCTFANSCWNRSVISFTPNNHAEFSTWFEEHTTGKDESIVKEILMISWAIWNAQNNMVWNKKNKLVAEVVKSARTTLNQWFFAHQRRMEPLLVFNEQAVEAEHWISPANDTIKVNVDGATFEATNSFGYGFIARSDGSLIEAVSTEKIGRVTPEITETAGIKEALSWIKSKGWQKVLLEVNCLVAVQAIKSSTHLPSAFGLLVQDCQQLLAAC